MKVFSGTVSNIRSAMETVDGTSTGHILACLVDDQPVRVKVTEVPLINEGDIVVVAGREKHGILNATAYKNRTTGTYGAGPAKSWGVLGLFFLLIGMGIELVQINPIGIPFILVGSGVIYESIQRIRANAAVQEAA